MILKNLIKLLFSLYIDFLKTKYKNFTEETFYKFYEELLEENEPLDTSFDDESSQKSEASQNFLYLTEKYNNVHVTKEFYEAIVNLLDTSKEDSNRIFTKILKKLSPIENWKTTLDEYEAQDQIKATIGKNILFKN